MQGAFERLAGLQGDIDGNLSSDNRPRGKTFARGAELARNEEVNADIPEAPVPSRATKKSVKKPAAKKVAAKKPVKKSAAKKRK